MYWVYILISLVNNQYYIGCTDNIERRLEEHNKGLSKYTRNKGPWKIVYEKRFTSLKEARKMEQRIKSWKSRKAIEKLIKSAAFV